MDAWGRLFEGCNCKAVCPCIFMLDPTERECKAAIAWHIEKGHFNDGNNRINLDNIILVAII